MKRRSLLALGTTAAIIVLVIAALANQKKPNLLVLEWASKGKADAPPTAVLIELGVKDNQATKWNGKASVSGAKVVHREGYRFRKEDKLLDPDGWEASSHRGIRVGPNQPQVAALEGLASVGVVLHLSDVKADATVNVQPPEGKDLQKATVNVKDVLTGKPQPIWDGAAVVRLITTTTLLNDAKTEDDFPAACYGPDGTLWVAYVGYHLKDESRRIEQKPFQEQPKGFKDLSTPEFGDQVFVKYHRNGQWSKSFAVTDDKQDIVRCAIAAEKDGSVWVVYSANRSGKYVLCGRKLDLNAPEAVALPRPNLGNEESYSDFPIPYLSPVACTSQDGEVHVGCQADYDSGYTWTTRGKMGTVGVTFSKSRNHWHHDIVADGTGKVTMGFDDFIAGDYDIVIGGPLGLFGQPLQVAAGSSRFEARPSLCYDPNNRLWVAYEEGPELWGKDYGALDDDDGEPLFSARSVRVVCLQDDKLVKPTAELPTSAAKKPHPVGQAGGMPGPNYERAMRYSGPSLGLDGKGRLWLTYRVKFGSRYSSHPGSYWLTYARCLEGDKWSEPIEVPQSDGYLDHRPVLLPHPAGGLLIVHSGDGRYTTPETLQSRIWTSYVDLPGDPVEPKLVPLEAGKKDDKLVKRAEAEAVAVKRIRDYRIEVGDKKLKLLRGEFHRHTEISWDGGPDGSLEDMFRYGIDAAQMDWIGNGDHDSGGGREYSWWLIQKYTDAYHVKDRFTPMFTYERSVAYPHGHRNCVFAKRGVRTLPRLAEPKMADRVGGVHADDTKMLYRYLRELDGVCAVHTSATSMGTDWRDNDPLVEPMVEIYQGDRMSYEKEEAPRAGFDPKENKPPANIAGWYPKGFINLALGEKGYKLGFQASSDHWSTHISYCVVLAEEHSREGILAAMKKRHVYGATDDIIVNVKCGDAIMGDETKTTMPPKLQLHVIGTKPLAQIDVLRDSEVVETIKPGQQEYKGEWTDPKPLKGVHYYYIRVVQEDQELAWASPIWIDFAP